MVVPALVALVLAALGETSCLRAATCRNVAGYDTTLGCVPSLAPTTTPLLGLHVLTRCQCNWDVDVNFNTNWFDTHGCTDAGPCIVPSGWNFGSTSVARGAGSIDVASAPTVVSTTNETALKTALLPIITHPTIGNSVHVSGGGSVGASSGARNVMLLIDLDATGFTVCQYTMVNISGSFSYNFDVTLNGRTGPKWECWGTITYTNTGSNVTDIIAGSLIGAWNTGNVVIAGKPSFNSANDFITLEAADIGVRK
jgi:hypothetical protein